MENASKALIIAGAILLSILIIALGIYVFNIAKGASNTDQLDQLEVQSFNSTFTQYQGKRLGSQVTELINKVISNLSTNKDADDRLPDIIYLESRTDATSGQVVFNSVKQAKTGSASATRAVSFTKTDDAGKVVTELGFADADYNAKGSFVIKSDSANSAMNEMGKLRSNISERHYYQVDFHNEIASGLVDYVVIKY